VSECVCVCVRESMCVKTHIIMLVDGCGVRKERKLFINIYAYTYICI
jgi:hypothetical protein